MTAPHNILYIPSLPYIDSVQSVNGEKKDFPFNTQLHTVKYDCASGFALAHCFVFDREQI